MKKIDKILYISLGILVVIITILGILKINQFVFELISLAANILLIIIFRMIKNILKIEFSKKQKILIIGTIVLTEIFYFVSVLCRNFIYYWDYSCYYSMQLSLEDSFNTSIFSGIRSFISTTWSGEYGNFIAFFPEIIFKFTSRTIDNYVLSCVFVFTPYIIVALSFTLKKICQICCNISEDNFLLLALIAFILFPILHSTFIYGQPDVFGITFILLIIALTIDYDFIKLEKPRLALLWLATFLLLITRRWFMYWIVSYYICYAVKIIIVNVKNKVVIKKILLNGIIFGMISIVLILLLLFPLFKNIIASNFASSYSYYMSGGFGAEILYQIRHLGYLMLAICCIGLIYGIIKKEYRITTIGCSIQYVLTIFLFTRIQNMGLHHSLILLPMYVYLIYMCIILILKQKKIIKVCASILLVGTMAINFVFGIIGKTDTKIFTDVRLSTPIEEDYYQIEEVSNWLKNNLNEENTAYMIPHNEMYNPDKFRNFYMPDKTISTYLPYGSAVLGTQSFPIEILTAKYVITTDPFINNSMSGYYNDVFCKLIKLGKFEVEKSFDMENGYSLIIYERTKAVDTKEVDLYENEIKETTSGFEPLYVNVLNKFKEENLTF